MTQAICLCWLQIWLMITCPSNKRIICFFCVCVMWNICSPHMVMIFSFSRYDLQKGWFLFSYMRQASEWKFSLFCRKRSKRKHFIFFFRHKRLTVWRCFRFQVILPSTSWKKSTRVLFYNHFLSLQKYAWWLTGRWNWYWHASYKSKCIEYGKVVEVPGFITCPWTNQ